MHNITPLRPKPEAIDYFGGCPTCWRNDGYLNVGREHWFICHRHRVKWLAGENLGAPWASFPVAADAKPGDETPATWVRVALFGNTVTPLTPRLIKGALVYCEGRLTLGTWTDRDGQAKSGLNLSAWTVQPMGQIGRQRPGKAKARRELAEELDDALAF